MDPFCLRAGPWLARDPSPVGPALGTIAGLVIYANLDMLKTLKTARRGALKQHPTAGWKLGTVSNFLDLSPEEALIIEILA